MAKRVTIEDLARKLDLVLLRIENLEAKLNPEKRVEEQQVMDQAQAAKFLGVSVNSFKKHIRNKLSYRRVNRKLLFAREEVMNWLATSRQATKTTPRVLVVEDNNLERTEIKQFLKKSGFKVLEAKNGIEGKEIFFKKLPEVVVTDILMPGCDGIDLIGEIAAVHPETGFVAITGGYEKSLLDPGHILNMAKLQGHVKTFQKPLDFDDLIVAVRELVDAHYSDED